LENDLYNNGAIGVLWVIPWLFINKSTPEKHPWITEEELNLIVDSSKSGLGTVSNVKLKCSKYFAT
jgi:ACS family hexuronate transporter-like MFS transporter